ncbi:MAG: alpha-amylase/4-alpha-glucanotransferase domain-containing protein [Chloroflexota bacterium]
MAPRISLALVLHNHQPVGNFGYVIAANHDAAYLPMIDALERHPEVRLGLHYTGPLLEWLRSERPQTVERLGALHQRGQVEVLGGGWCEPVLASLPERDRVGQLRRMASELATTFGERPRGAWLAERVWEPDVPTSLHDAGYAWTIVDDAHFRSAGIEDGAMWGPYSTDDQGRRISVFGTEQGLRYRIPFGTVDSVIEHLRANATETGERLGVMGDDGEKFGAWPTTWEHCWGPAERWVDRFFEALEANRDWLTTTTPSTWLERQPPVGRVYLPTGSYAEMGEWSLPPDQGREFSELLHAAVAEGRPEARYLRGGFWRNFQVKYREINDLHKQMLRTSAAVEALPEGPARDAATDHLYRGQSNDCYWHGVFGGIYLSHMRLATLEHLIAAQDICDRQGREQGLPVDGIRSLDADLDGVPELVVTSPGQSLVLKVSEGAGIGTWDIRAPRHALASVLRRRREAYHARLVEFEAGHGTATSGDATASIHDIVKVREPGLAARLRYDPHERRSGLVHVLPPTMDAHEFAAAGGHELADLADGRYTVLEATPAEVVVERASVIHAEGGDVPVLATKRFRLDGDRRSPGVGLEVTIRSLGDQRVAARLALGWSLNLLGGGGNPAAWWETPHGRVAFDSDGRLSGATAIACGNDHLGVTVRAETSGTCDIWWASVDTVSISEDGFERTHQGSGLTFVWPLDLAPGEERTVGVRLAVATAFDRAVEDPA